MKLEISTAFFDELEKIAGLKSWVKKRPAAMAKWTRDSAENTGKAVASFARPVKSFKRGWKATWSPGGKPLHPVFKGLMAFGAYNDIQQMRPKEDPAGLGRSRVHRGLSAVGGQVGGFMGAPFGLVGGTAASMIGGKAGDLAGRAVDKVRGYRRATPAQEQLPHLPPKPVGLQE